MLIVVLLLLALTPLIVLFSCFDDKDGPKKIKIKPSFSFSEEDITPRLIIDPSNANNPYDSFGNSS